MGTSTYVYVGPYIRSTSVDISTTKNIRTCSNVDCTVSKKYTPIQGKFCSECGSVVALVPKAINERRILKFYDLFTDKNVVIPENLKFIDADDEFSTAEFGDYDAWLLNKKEACNVIPRVSMSPDYEDMCLDIDDKLNKDNALFMFREYYGELLNYIEKRFNVKLEVRYGILVYFS